MVTGSRSPAAGSGGCSRRSPCTPEQRSTARLLAELVWGDEQPADPVAALQTNVARLRRLLPEHVTIETGPGATGW